MMSINVDKSLTLQGVMVHQNHHWKLALTFNSYNSIQNGVSVIYLTQMCYFLRKKNPWGFFCVGA